jgi:type IV pilus assembly protein PilQ
MKPQLSGTNLFVSTVRLAGIAGLLGVAMTAQADVTKPWDERRGLATAEPARMDVDVPAQMVTQIEVRPAGEEVTVVVTADGRLYPHADMVDDSRLVVDLPAVGSGLDSSVVRGRHPLLRKVRVGHHADKVRLVFDTLQHPAYTVDQSGREVRITLKPSAVVSAGTESVAALLPNVPSEEPLSPAVFQPGRRATKVLGPAAQKFRVQTVQMASDDQGAGQAKDERTDDLVAGQTRYSGRRISLDFQQADITNILRLIAEVSGFNIVVGEGVKAKVTMKLVSVPWDQALDMLLKMNGLGMIRQGTIVWVDTLTNIAKQQDEEAKAKDSKTKAEPLIDRVFYVKNLQAQELMTALRPYVSPRGVMQISQGSNALIVRETESRIAILRQLVDGLDLEVPQVQIEARIVQADTVYARGLGVQWGVQNSDFSPNTFSFVGNATGAFAPVAGTGNTTIPRDFIVNLPAQVGGLPAVPGIGFQFGKLAPGFGLDMRLSAGELLGLTKVIAAPKITTLDKREAKISQGESIPFQTTSLQGTQTTFVDANLELNVTPQITSRDPKENGKRILMRVRATRNAVGARSNPAGPSIDRREATTQVIVRDGETMVIGGVFVDTQNNNVQGVPYLSRIPVLGWLFKNKSESVSKQELLIFLTPSIVTT